jgi:uncharacterized membrane protein
MSQITGFLTASLLSAYTLYSACIFSPGNDFDFFPPVVAGTVFFILTCYFSYKKSEGNSS